MTHLLPTSHPVVRVAAFVSGLIVCAATVVWAAPPRAVEIRWDFRQPTPKQLQVWVDCPKDSVSTDLTKCGDPSRVVSAPESYRFELRRSDSVTLITIGEQGGDPGSSEYAITGTNLDEKDLNQLKKLLAGGGAPAAAQTSFAFQPAPPAAVYVKAVTEKLIAGGKMTVTFNLKRTEGTGQSAKETVTKTSGGLTFTIQAESPRITVSAGIGFSTAANPTVAIVKTATIVTFTKDGKDQQAYQQVITLKDNDTKLHPIQSLMTVANFRVYERLYASAGIRVDEKIFEQPVIGVTYRHPLTERMGLNVTGGVMFSRETEIVPDSGFTVGQKIDPTIGLTAEEIPTRMRYHVRPAVLVSLDF